jgi:hypothetical protein
MTKVETILQKAKSDGDFAVRIVKDPKATLASYNLTRLEFEQIVTQVKNLRGIWPADY